MIWDEFGHLMWLKCYFLHNFINLLCIPHFIKKGDGKVEKVWITPFIAKSSLILHNTSPSMSPEFPLRRFMRPFAIYINCCQSAQSGHREAAQRLA